MASRFWVGGTGTWDATTTHWSATSGGAGGASVPTASDDVFFDANSGAGTVTLSSGSPNVGNFNCTGFTGTLAFTGVGAGINIWGSLTLVAAMTLTVNLAFTINFRGNLSNTVTSAGKTLPPTNFGQTGDTGTWTLQDALATGSGSIVFNTGTLNTNGMSVTCGAFSTGTSSLRTLTLGSTTITLTSSGTALNWAVTANMTITANTATFVLSATNTDTSLNPSTLDLAGASITFSGAGQGTLRGGVWKNITRTGSASKTDNFRLTQNVTATGTLTLTGNSVTNRLLVNSDSVGTARTITAATVAASNVDLVDITGAGAASWNLSAITGGSGDAGGNTGITFTAAAQQTWQGTAGGNWSDVTKWTSRVPLPQDNVLIASAFVASQNVVGDMPRLGKNIDCTGATGNPTVVFNAPTSSYGSITFAAGMTPSFQSNFSLAGRGAHTLTSAGKTWAGFMTITAGGTYTLADAFTHTGNFSVGMGTFDAATNNVAVTIATFNITGSSTRTVSMGSGAWTITGTSGGVWQSATTGLTLNIGTAVVTFNGAGSVTITTGGVAMPSCTFTGTGGTDTFADAFTTAGTITLLGGTLATGNFNVTCGTFNYGSSTTRTLTLGSSVITVTGSGNAWTNSAIAGLTVTANTAVAVFTNVGSINGGSVNWNGLSFVLTGAGTPAVNGGGTVANLVRAGTTTKTDALSFNGDLTVTGTLALQGNSVTNRLFVVSNTVGAARTLTVNGSTTAAVTLAGTSYQTANVDLQDIVGAGTASWNLSAISGGSGDALGNSGITFTAAVTNFWRGGTGNWSDVTHWASSSGGAASSGRVPLPQDTARFDANSGTGTATTWDMPRLSRDLDLTGYAATLTSSTAASVFGSITIGAALVGNLGGHTLTLAGRSSHTITSAGKSVNSLTIAGPGGTYTQLDALTMSSSGTGLTITAGSWSSAGFAITGQWIATNGSLTRALTLGTSSVFLQATSGLPWNIVSTTGFSLSADLSTIVVATAAAVARTFAGAGLTYGTITYTVAASTGALIFTGANTIRTLNVADGRTVTFPASTTTTITAWNVNGAVGSLTTVNSSTGGTKATLKQSGTAAGAFRSLYVAVTDITGQKSDGTTATNQWVADVNSTLTSTLGWIQNVALSRTASDTAPATDTATRAFALGRAAADTAAATDAAARLVASSRSASDNAPATDAVAVRYQVLRDVTDTAPADSSSDRSTAVSRDAADTASSDSTTDRATAVTRTVIDSATWSDAVTRGLQLLRVITDLAPADSTVDRLVAMTRTVTDSAPATDSVHRRGPHPDRARLTGGASSNAILAGGATVRGVLRGCDVP